MSYVDRWLGPFSGSNHETHAAKRQKTSVSAVSDATVPNAPTTEASQKSQQLAGGLLTQSPAFPRVSSPVSRVSRVSSPHTPTGANIHKKNVHYLSSSRAATSATPAEVATLPRPNIFQDDSIANSANSANWPRNPSVSAGFQLAGGLLTAATSEVPATAERRTGPPGEWVDGIAALDPDRPPADVPSQRWEQFVKDAGRLLDGPFYAIAASLGWGALDLFGCDRDRPFARIDQAGLLWLLNGDELIALSENTATIKTKSGARHTFRRKPGSVGRVLAWELRDPAATAGSGRS
jgi:hypothetical protein